MMELDLSQAVKKSGKIKIANMQMKAHACNKAIFFWKNVRHNYTEQTKFKGEFTKSYSLLQGILKTIG